MRFIIYLFIIFSVHITFAQQEKTQVIKSYLKKNLMVYDLEIDDVSDLSISSQTFSKSMQVENIYVVQNYKGIKIFNSYSSFALDNETVVNAALSFSENIANNVNTISPLLSAEDAIYHAANALGINVPTQLEMLETKNKNSFIFSNGGVSLKNIPVDLVYQPSENGKLILAWDLSILLLDRNNHYSVRVDATTGELLEIHDWVLKCSFGENYSHQDQETTANTISSLTAAIPKSFLFLNSNSSYRVFPLPLVAPNDGSNVLIINPSHPVASPYGWHNTNLQNYSITRGNNADVKTPRVIVEGNNYSPDGTDNLYFDFPFISNTNPIRNKDASLVQQFYITNMMHDIWYNYGFDEESGNFQVNNFGRGGDGNDPVTVIGLRDTWNNAMFETDRDGEAVTLSTYLWDGIEDAGNPLIINNSTLQGEYGGSISSFGGVLPLEGMITSELVIMKKEDTDDYYGCGNIINTSEIAGKIALVKAGGSCSEDYKLKTAEDAGATAVIIISSQSGPTEPMQPGYWGPRIGIPSIIIDKDDGDPILDALINGNEINASLKEVPPYPRDSGLDNLVVAHEYGHGISSRLAGGRLTVGCGTNDETIDEGLSDWYGLMLTIKEDDLGTDRKGVGTYALGQSVNGDGIRRYPYSTDMNINPETYDDIKMAAIPHGVGAIGAQMLWEMTWNLIDEYGFDPDLHHGTGGNNIAMQLVIDGLKLQRCAPGFVDVRDAILQADELANGGDNKCLIWKAFAKRGLGFSADQGSRFDTTDGVEAFDLPPECSLGINDTGSLNNYSIYPNPTNGEINIKTRKDAGNVEVSIIDMRGRIVFSKNVHLHSSVNLDASGLEAGIYIMKIKGRMIDYTSKLIFY